MAKIISYEGKRLPIIEGFVIYPLNDALIIRAKSGFTAEGLQNNPKYDFCRMNASEFDAISRMCKLIRMGLHDVLPKQNKLAVVNAFTKKMHSLLVNDKLHEKGARTVATTLTTKDGKKALMGYDFNPNSSFAVNYAIDEEQLILQVNTATDATLKRIGLRFLVLDLNLETNEGALHLGPWHFERSKTLALCYDLPKVPKPIGSLFYLVEVQAVNEATSSFIFDEDENKGIVFLDLVV
jgi:hypothetical protein